MLQRTLSALACAAVAMVAVASVAGPGQAGASPGVASAAAAATAGTYTGGWFGTATANGRTYLQATSQTASVTGNATLALELSGTGGTHTARFAVPSGQTLVANQPETSRHGATITIDGVTCTGVFQLDDVGTVSGTAIDAYGIEFAADCGTRLDIGELARTVPIDASSGYAMVTTNGSVYARGSDRVLSYMGTLILDRLNAPIVGMARTTDGGGYWLAASDGGIFAFGDAAFHGSMGGHPLNQPIVGIAADPATGGYWEVARDGGIFAFTAPFYGSMGGHPLNQPIVGIAPTPDGGGYWEVASDGGIFAFGDAHFYGSMGGQPLNQPIVGMAATHDGHGYWMVARDGGLFAFGDAGFHGSMGGQPLNQPIVGMATTPGGGGYWEVASDGGLFSFGDASFLGSWAATTTTRTFSVATIFTTSVFVSMVSGS